jgi:hypothetical protein
LDIDFDDAAAVQIIWICFGKASNNDAKPVGTRGEYGAFSCAFQRSQPPRDMRVLFLLPSKPGEI